MLGHLGVTCCFRHGPSPHGLPADSFDGAKRCIPMLCVHARQTPLPLCNTFPSLLPEVSTQSNLFSPSA